MTFDTYMGMTFVFSFIGMGAAAFFVAMLFVLVVKRLLLVRRDRRLDELHEALRVERGPIRVTAYELSQLLAEGEVKLVERADCSYPPYTYARQVLVARGKNLILK